MKRDEESTEDEEESFEEEEDSEDDEDVVSQMYNISAAVTSFYSHSILVLATSYQPIPLNLSRAAFVLHLT